MCNINLYVKIAKRRGPATTKATNVPRLVCISTQEPRFDFILYI